QEAVAVDRQLALPATGRLIHLAFPDGSRADTGVRQGDEISPWYDPMIAKLITHGPTREVALLRLHKALAGTQVAGSVTNLAFLRKLAKQEDFAAGNVDTGLIDRHIETLAIDPVACTRSRSLAALGAMGLDSAADPLTGFSLWAPNVQTCQLDYGDDRIEARVETLGPGVFRVSVGDAVHDIRREGAAWIIDGDKVEADVVRHDAGVSVFWGNGYHFVPVDPLAVAAEASGGAGHVEAPMPGLVKALSVKVGDHVAAGDRLAVLEAMKMEHSLTAGRDGIVAEVLVEAGAQVDAGATLIVLEEGEA
ncbi:MAG: biotin/lipoyl-containing protein, partial [Pseudomonadota bacterium]